MARIFLAILGLAVFFGSGVFASHVPDPQGFVNDFAGMLSSKFRIQLEQSLQNFEKETQAEIAVVTILSLQQDSIEDFAARLFEEWKIGKAQQDNGVLLLVTKEEQEVRIEVGYGLEPFITDGRAGSIIRQDIAPLFKQGNYEEGVQKAVASLQGHILESNPESAQEKVRGKVSGLLGLGNSIFFLIAFSVIYLLDFLSRSKSFWLGGLFGGVMGMGLGWLFESLIGGVFLVAGLSMFGLFLDYILSKNYQDRKRHGLPTGFFASRGGFFRDGGFGGFGGGGSGGGGASGRW